MPRRVILTDAERQNFLALPTDDDTLIRHWRLNDEDHRLLETRRRDDTRLGLALQLYALRYPGRLIQRGEVIPESSLAILADQLQIEPGVLATFAHRVPTRYEQLAVLRHKAAAGHHSQDGSAARYRPRVRQSGMSWLREPPGKAGDAAMRGLIGRLEAAPCRLYQRCAPGRSSPSCHSHGSGRPPLTAQNAPLAAAPSSSVAAVWPRTRAWIGVERFRNIALDQDRVLNHEDGNLDHLRLFLPLGRCGLRLDLGFGKKAIGDPSFML